jgi:hypothetical protein
LITGLTPSTTYKVKFRAKGGPRADGHGGASLQVRDHDDFLGATTMASVVVTPPNNDNVWRDYSLTFTTNASGNGSTSVALYLVDDDLGSVNGPSSLPCAVFAAGETCFDDIGVFKSSDVP